MSSKYIDVKLTTWGRYHFNSDADLKSFAEDFEKGYLPSEICPDNERGFVEYENLYETEEWITPQENDNQPTIEMYEPNEENTFQEVIWDNVNKFNQ